jgi:hypothetical protein
MLVDLLSRPGCAELVDALARQVVMREIDPFSAADQLLACYCGSQVRPREAI